MTLALKKVDLQLEIERRDLERMRRKGKHQERISEHVISLAVVGSRWPRPS